MNGVVGRAFVQALSIKDAATLRGLLDNETDSRLAPGPVARSMDGVSAVRVEHQHLFAVPVVTGFGYITEVANWPAYWPGIVRVEPGGRWAEPGDETNVVLKLLGREAKLRLRRFGQDRLVEYDSSQAGLPDARHERHFAADGRGFRYRLVVEFQPRRGLVGICDRVLVRRGIDRALLRTIANLERELPL